MNIPPDKIPNPLPTSRPRGWYWQTEPSKTVLSVFESNKSRAICPKCCLHLGFTKDSNGSGNATYGCFKCKGCATKFKAKIFWTECMHLPADKLPLSIPDPTITPPAQSSTLSNLSLFFGKATECKHVIG
ncbi:hypothetical protein K493DRAFT_303087 [Basidiobolus meristosporus CBS 931.73]|uniref:Uncharacterized protein n=1 Tax=Basidiobolus meristosporus CBS 931.73 TaxID=1314790 RepID=A0A1Y1Y447_9FUNG|nr:hypothetical protein K493DRAFT_303087 [Basidiobolus meristosporus CBS 931.73]|eukprot:ORX92801.1 hypothetical protein K493DRAFT_303087 [Basidiobolus meristosporus CBS 931.73]